MANRLAREAGISEKGYRLVVNCGPDGGQVVPHLHLHLLGGGQMGMLGWAHQALDQKQVLISKLEVLNTRKWPRFRTFGTFGTARSLDSGPRAQEADRDYLRNLLKGVSPRCPVLLLPRS